jgi:hypothetical protein
MTRGRRQTDIERELIIRELRHEWERNTAIEQALAAGRDPDDLRLN